MADQWGMIGFPMDSRLSKLYYEPESGQFLAHLYKPTGGGRGVMSVYARRFKDKTYRQLTPDDGLSYEGLLVCPDSPKVLANVFRVKKKHGEDSAMEWDSIREIDAETGGITTVLSSGDLDVEPPYSRAWISRLRKVRSEYERARAAVGGRDSSAYEDEPDVRPVYGKRDNDLLCTVSFRKKKSAGREEVEDFVCKVSPADEHYTKITRLNHGREDALASAGPGSRTRAV